MIKSEIDELEVFALDFSERGLSYGYLPTNIETNSYEIKGITGITWYRHGQFQVEMFIVPPNRVIPEHSHPNVSSYEMYLGGDIAFSRSGKWIVEEDLIRVPNSTDNRGALIKVKTTDMHGGSFGPRGGVFMSIQKWAEGVEPHSVALDYIGVVLDENHASRVKLGEAELKTEITWKDSATLEETEPTYI